MNAAELYLFLHKRKYDVRSVKLDRDGLHAVIGNERDLRLVAELLDSLVLENAKVALSLVHQPWYKRLWSRVRGNN